MIIADLLGGVYDRLAPSHPSPNLLPQFEFTGIEEPPSQISDISPSLNFTSLPYSADPRSFTCAYNSILSDDVSLVPAPISKGNLSLVCLSSDLLAVAFYELSDLGHFNESINGIYFGKYLRSFPAPRSGYASSAYKYVV